MNDEQLKAARSLHRALDRAHAVNLSGGVYDTSFIVFPSSADRESVVESIFSGDESIGMVIPSRMGLDGGAGV